MVSLLFKDLGLMDYAAALSLQERLLELKHAQRLADILLLVEHPRVYTIGRGGKVSNLLNPGDVPVFRTTRGGDVTYHGPGQIVVYPLVDLRSRLRRAVHRYLRDLERVTIHTLRDFSIEAEGKPPWTGVWIGTKKIASIGIAVRKGVTYHGVALNVNTELAYFRRIIPCGLPWAEMTSMARELGAELPTDPVKRSFVDHFMGGFGYSEIKELCLEDIPIGSRLGSPEAPITSASSGS